MSDTTSILLVGVGGQGTILAAKILTLGLLESGYDVKMSEIHGMSQRGGSVSSHVRYGKKVYSPVIERGGADIMVSFEQMEALRWIDYLKPGAKVIVNKQIIKPNPVLLGRAEYSDKILDAVSAAADTKTIDAIAEAKAIGNTRAVNILLMGSVVKIMQLGHIDWKSIIAKSVRPAFIEVNQKAFDKGYSLA
ncbi:MAG: indolepyruvate oxidoreductase subunit beta [Turicibacter sp.]|nr:indolepyruvate oxidoreductase subunit beta [Turicibacter sp.]